MYKKRKYYYGIGLIVILSAIIALTQPNSLNKFASADTSGSGNSPGHGASSPELTSEAASQSGSAKEPAAKPAAASAATAAQDSPKSTPQTTPTNNGTNSSPPPSANTYQVFDQFDGGTLNPALWEAVSLPKGYRNNEEQDYLPGQVHVANGNLQITASKDGGGAWHSGEVHSKWNYMYGEFEVRMAVSAAAPGVWPAAWLMGTSNNWPDNGEIDIMENINGESKVYGTIHGGGSNYHWQLQKSVQGINVTQYHVYKIVKKPGLISWWVDGTQYAEWHQSDVPAGGIWPFESNRNYALLNLAMGGSWPGPTNASTPSTVILSIDYFSVKNGS